MKDESGGKIIDEFVGFRSNMYSMNNSDGIESNTAKGVNIATEFNQFKQTLFNKKVLRHKMRQIQGKKQTKKHTKNWEHTKSTKYHYLFLMIKDLFSIMVFKHLLIFIKTSKYRCIQMIINKKRLKKIFIKGKDSHKCLQIKANACKWRLDRWVDKSKRQ